MPLPWFKAKPQTGVIMATTRQPDEKKDESSENDGLKSCARDLMDAISAGDESKAAAAIRAAFEICDSEPHEEGEHTNDEDESYDSMNQKAAE
jgi:hypothetical protein